jgi:SAM-dependent methyltransferase
MSGRDHWDGVYGSKAEEDLTWFEACPELSLALIRAYLQPGGAVVDVGAGASRLVDHLLAEEIGRVTAVDISGAALEKTRARLGEAAARVAWVVADVTRWRPERTFALWHDRAVFHFLTMPKARAGYVAALIAALEPGGIAVISTFAEDGPERCSGLPVVRYAPEALAAEIEAHAPGQFRLVESHYRRHITPRGGEQSFQTSVFVRRGVREV